VILEAADGPAAAWRARWDSLTLFTPARHGGLPGTPFPGDPDHYPTRDEVVAYLTDYAGDLPVAYDRPAPAPARPTRWRPRKAR
jgi:putative flavoprotein involved in K+ transport